MTLEMSQADADMTDAALAAARVNRWVTPELRKLAEPDEYGRTMPFAVYVRYEPGRPEHVMRNYRLEDAEATADRLIAEHPRARVHVSLDVCG